MIFSGRVYGCRSNQRIHASTLATLTIQSKDATGMTPERLRNSHAVDGTIISVPNHAICRTVPPAMLVRAAHANLKMLVVSFSAASARWHKYRHNRMQNRPATSVI